MLWSLVVVKGLTAYYRMFIFFCSLQPCESPDHSDTIHCQSFAQTAEGKECENQTGTHFHGVVGSMTLKHRGKKTDMLLL